jgi:serine/threonine-protein kinase haspin
MMKEHTKDEWRGFFPKTNVFWLHYLLDKLSTDVYYKNKKSKVHRSAATKIRLLKDSYLDLYKSAFDYVTSDKENVNK